MSENTSPRSGTLLVWTARYLLAVYLVAVVLARAGVIALEPYVPPRLFFRVTVLIGLTAVAARYWSVARAAVETGRRSVRRFATAETVHLLHLTTRNLTVAFFALVALAAVGVPVHLHVAVGALYYPLIGLTALTLVTRDDRSAAVAAKSGSVALVTALLLSPYVGVIRETVEPSAYVLVAVLLGVVFWKSRSVFGAGTGERGEWPAAFPFSDRGAVVVLTAVAAVLYGYRLGSLPFFGDEFLGAGAAAGYHFTGEFYRWDWIASEPLPERYDRAWPHTLLIAASYAVFGISEWAARLPSALAGIVCVPVAFSVFRYFLEDGRIAAAATAGAVAYPNFVHFFRWTRMYALLIPIYIALTYLSFRAVTGSNPIDFRSETLNGFVRRQFDFDFRIAAAALPVLYLGYEIHYNTLTLVAAAYVFVLVRFFQTGARRYRNASFVGAVGVLSIAGLVRYTDSLEFLPQFLSFFARENTVYVQYAFQYPFQTAFGAAAFALGAVVLALDRNRERREKLTYLYVVTLTSLVFFVYVGDRYASFAYLVHVIPFALLLVVYTYSQFVRTHRSAVVRGLLIALLAGGVVLPMATGAHGRDYESLYYEEKQDFESAYGTIVENFDEEDALFGQYLRRYYLQELPEDATVVDMESHRRYGPSEFAADLRSAGSGWVTWLTRKSYHVHPDVHEFVDENFRQYHGSGVDETGIEVYYFNESTRGDANVSTGAGREMTSDRRDVAESSGYERGESQDG